ncbi:hypothetical protein DOY81_011251 [Sarcophaga bullata]|nr:hypothetical protein DOY81_011251 [Sarcophaga bullata]
MDSCLFMFGINKELIGAIEVNSTQWKNTIQPNAWICSVCWRQLYDFSQFYTRIEEAHSNLASVLKVTDECKAVVCTKNEQGNVEDDCKEDKDEQQDESDFEDVPLNQRRKRFRSERNTANVKADPLKKTKRQKSPNKNKAIKGSIKSRTIENEVEESSIKQESITLDTCDIADDYNTDTESEYHDGTKYSERGKKKRKNPDEKTCQEHDKIIAENFQIFCSICQVSLENFIALRKHFREEHKKRGFVVCCRKKIFTRPVLVDHIHFHMDPNYFKCKFCERVYSERSTLESHLKYHEDSQNGRTHSCETCGKTFVGADN